MTRLQPLAAVTGGAALAILAFGLQGEAGRIQVRSAPVANYHSGKQTPCAGCHTAGPAAAANPALKEHGPNAVCLKCHDGKPDIPDVLGGPPEIYDGGERAGGHFADAPGPNNRAHDLAGPGGQGGLACVDCHDPHGNDSYRNLLACGDLVGEAFVNPAARGLDKYRRRNIAYGRNVEAFCVRCHPETLSRSVSRSHTKHPSTSSGQPVAIAGHSSGRGPRKTDALHWVLGEGSGFAADGAPVPRMPFAVCGAASYAAASQVSEDNEVFCISCHKAHGSAHDFGLQWDYGAEEGEYQASGCQQCHNVGK